MSGFGLDPVAVRHAMKDPEFSKAVWGADYEHQCEMLREQLLGDLERLLDIEQGREDSSDVTALAGRMSFVYERARTNQVELPTTAVALLEERLLLDERLQVFA